MGEEKEVNGDTQREHTENSTEGEDNLTNSTNSTDTNTNENDNSTKVSNYLQNIKISNSSAGLALTEKDNAKDAPLLIDTKTVVRFSPAWKQVRLL